MASQVRQAHLRQHDVVTALPDRTLCQIEQLYVKVLQ